MSFYLLRALLVTLCFALWHAQAQIPSFISVDTAGGARRNAGWSIAVDRFGNTYVAGSFGAAGFGGAIDFSTTNLTSAGNSDGFVAKFDVQGSCLWARQIAGPDEDDAYAVVVRSDDSILVAGEFVGTNSIGTTTMISHGGYDIFLAAFDASGGLIWARAVGTAGDDFAIALAPATSGSGYFTGSFVGDLDLGGGISFSSTDDDALLLKLDSSGVPEWARTAGGDGVQLGSDVKVDPQGNVFWAGEFDATASFGNVTLTNQGPNVFLAKYDSEGTRLSVQSLGSGQAADLPRLALTSDGGMLCSAAYSGNYSVAGQALPLATNDVLLASFDSAGALQWVTAFGGSQLEVCTGLLIGSSGDAYLVGHFRGMMPVGNTNITSAGVEDIFVVRCSADGQFQGAMRAGGLSPDLALACALAPSGDIRLTGSFSGAAQFGSILVTSPDALPKTFVAIVAPPPTIRINSFPTHVLLSWPAHYRGFTLQYSTLVPPWNDVTPAPTLQNGEWVFTNDLSQPRRFFRLRK